MTTKTELNQLIEKLSDNQLEQAKEALTLILNGKSSLPVCDLGTAEDIATLFNTVVYEDKEKN
ncbi:hypothetical protein [Dendrosporobacter sp. 1207_IL3150]|uniref:hypothetical protein n=1 Tax=Dendrosporobacter sp. 1207_IL3150 TaxID=3084054 RepID=UPI002FD96542